VLVERLELVFSVFGITNLVMTCENQYPIPLDMYVIYISAFFCLSLLFLSMSAYLVYVCSTCMLAYTYSNNWTWVSERTDTRHTGTRDGMI